MIFALVPYGVLIIHIIFNYNLMINVIHLEHLQFFATECEKNMIFLHLTHFGPTFSLYTMRYVYYDVFMGYKGTLG